MRLTFAKDTSSALVIDIGYVTPFHSCVYYISITREYYDKNGDVEHMRWIKGLFRSKKYPK